MVMGYHRNKKALRGSVARQLTSPDRGGARKTDRQTDSIFLLVMLLLLFIYRFVSQVIYKWHHQRVTRTETVELPSTWKHQETPGGQSSVNQFHTNTNQSEETLTDHWCLYDTHTHAHTHTRAHTHTHTHTHTHQWFNTDERHEGERWVSWPLTSQRGFWCQTSFYRNLSVLTGAVNLSAVDHTLCLHVCFCLTACEE